MHETYGANDTCPSDRRRLNIGNLVKHLDLILEKLACDRHDNDRQEELRALVQSGAQLGYDLFKQPTTWILDWSGGGTDLENGLVVFPALLQTADSNGKQFELSVRYTGAKVMEV